ncbi:hypothetical protein [Bosea sp. (in: a-proteobacteria)]|uniref:hypothetical protein n=1 Tax=Bosea sp. (in: a-proteobacteria) TaxID=1871050 RepID=UPI004034BFF1
MRKNLTVKSLALLFAFMAGFSPPVPGTGSAEAQVRSSGREVSRQAVRDHRQGSVNRAHRGRTVVRHHRPAHVVVVHPRRHWNRGGAIAAGAAIGFIAGAAAVSWAGQPPRSGYCWFYTTPARTTGFWDWCPVR